MKNYQIERSDENEHDEHGVEREVPMKYPWADLQHVHDFKDDELEHGAGECEVDAEDELEQSWRIIDNHFNNQL